MTAWEETVLSAVLGTERQAYERPKADGELGRLLEKISGDSEHVLMTAAALLVQYERVGRAAERFPGELPPSCPDEDKQFCSDGASRILRDILQQGTEYLLREWLVLAGRRDQICRHDLLPDLLDAMTRHKNLLPLALPVLGKRGSWLAAQNSAWANLAEEALSDDDWELGSKTARTAWLTAYRKSNRSKAIELLQTRWKEESAGDRASFLEIFETGLGPDDEPFLESCLLDRSKEVRKKAALLLARLPDSRLARRLLERALACLTIEKKFLGARMIVSPAGTLDAEMKTIGVEEKPPASQTGLGPQAWWLLQTIAFVPPRVWCATYSSTPPDLLALAKKTDYFEAVYSGWIEAACLHRDGDWAEALLAHRPGRIEGTRSKLMRLLAPDRAEEFIFTHVASGKGLARLTQLVEASLRRLDGPWSAAHSRLALDIISDSVAKPAELDAYYGLGARLAAQFIDVSLYAEAVREQSRLDAGASALTKGFTEFMDLFKLRHDLYEEFAR